MVTSVTPYIKDVTKWYQMLTDCKFTQMSNFLYSFIYWSIKIKLDNVVAKNNQQVTLEITWAKVDYCAGNNILYDVLYKQGT